MNETPQSCDCTRQCVKGLQAYCKYWSPNVSTL
jgi:hypothetical protein